MTYAVSPCTPRQGGWSTDRSSPLPLSHRPPVQPSRPDGLHGGRTADRLAPARPSADHTAAGRGRSVVHSSPRPRPIHQPASAPSHMQPLPASTRCSPPQLPSPASSSSPPAPISSLCRSSLSSISSHQLPPSAPSVSSHQLPPSAPINSLRQLRQLPRQRRQPLPAPVSRALRVPRNARLSISTHPSAAPSHRVPTPGPAPAATCR